jgi:hypothetical protein
MKSAALLVIASLLVMACVPQADLDEATRMLNEAESANSTMRTRVSDLENENADLRAQLAKQPDCSSP